MTRSAKEKRTKWPLVKNEILAKKYLRNKKFAGSKLLSHRKYFIYHSGRINIISKASLVEILTLTFVAV